MNSSFENICEKYSLIDLSTDFSWLVKENYLPFEFENPKLTRHRRVPLSMQAFFGKEGTEEYDLR